MCPALEGIHSYGSEVATIESLQIFAAVHSELQRRLVVCYRRFGTIGALFKGYVYSLLGQTLLWCKHEYWPNFRYILKKNYLKAHHSFPSWEIFGKCEIFMCIAGKPECLLRFNSHVKRT
jgi:hypothetical protein